MVIVTGKGPYPTYDAYKVWKNVSAVSSRDPCMAAWLRLHHRQVLPDKVLPSQNHKKNGAVVRTIKTRSHGSVETTDTVPIPQNTENMESGLHLEPCSPTCRCVHLGISEGGMLVPKSLHRRLCPSHGTLVKMIMSNLLANDHLT